jgi:hypothetical protein
MFQSLYTTCLWPTKYLSALSSQQMIAHSHLDAIGLRQILLEVAQASNFAALT